jgi:hypothetical protein
MRVTRTKVILVIAALVVGLVAAATSWEHRKEARRWRYREWVEARGAWRGVELEVRRRTRAERLDPLTAADLDDGIRILRVDRESHPELRFLWLVNPSLTAWDSSFRLSHDFTCLFAVVDPATDEIVGLLSAIHEIEVGGDSMAVELDIGGNPSISPEGARRLIEGWVRIER